MRRGIFISIEGPDGSGKSTQIKNIKDYFEGKQFEVVFTKNRAALRSENGFEILSLTRTARKWII